ncbi:class V chitinase Chi100 [Aspergillus luchuensis]|uniref:Class V chitinase Chi100 n=1 Tax=Aspergillus kawachii TaxID=1069201 RepID=A0A146FQH3_ASPKA|nr:class V chitinase Chi100 [Aspergillus luchuensis]
MGGMAARHGSISAGRENGALSGVLSLSTSTKWWDQKISHAVTFSQN